MENSGSDRTDENLQEAAGTCDLGAGGQGQDCGCRHEEPPPIRARAAYGNRNCGDQHGGGLPPRAEKKKRGCLLNTLIILGIASAVAILFAVFALVFALAAGIESLSSVPQLAASKQFYPKSFKEECISGGMLDSDKILIIDVRGIILGGSDGFSDVANADTICEMLDQAGKDDNVKAVILKLDTPGGEVNAADRIHRKLLEIKDQGIILVSSMESIAASGGYYIAAPSNHIVANRLTLTGSIGVIIQGFNYKGLLDKIGVHSETYKSGAMKDMLDGSKVRTEEEKQIVQHLVDECYSEFVKIVAAGRASKGLTEEKVRGTSIGDGRVISGKDALELGLVDQLGYFDDAVSKAAELAGIGNYRLVKYANRFSFFDIFSEMSAPEKEMRINFGFNASSSWQSLIEPGKMYFLPK